MFRTTGTTPRKPTAPGREVPLALRKAIAGRFRSDAAVLEAAVTLGTSATEVLGWGAMRADRVLKDLYRLHGHARENPAAAAALHDIDRNGVEALVGMLEIPSATP